MSNSTPQGWIKADLEHFSEINPRLTKKSELEDETLVSFIKMEDVSNFARVQNKSIRKYSEVSKGFTSFEDNDVLVAKITPCFENGKGGYVVNLINGVGFGSTEFHVLRAKSSADSKYIYHFTNFKSFRLEAESNMTGSAGQRRVPTDFFKSYQAIFPPRPEQQKIAAILTSVDDVIESTQAQINKLKDLKTGMMQELLTKGIGHSEFKESPVGRIPKAWDVKKVGDLVDVIDPQPDHRTPPEVLDGVPYIGLGDINKDGLINFASARKVSKEAFEKQISNFEIHDGAFIFGKIGTIGNPSILPKERFYCLSANIILLTAKDTPLLRYFYQIFKSGVVNEQVSMQTNTTSQPALGIKKVRDFVVPIPSDKEEMIKLISSLESIDLKLDRCKEKLRIFGDTKKALMQDLLTGKVRVKVN